MNYCYPLFVSAAPLRCSVGLFLVFWKDFSGRFLRSLFRLQSLTAPPLFRASRQVPRTKRDEKFGCITSPHFEYQNHGAAMPRPPKIPQ